MKEKKLEKIVQETLEEITIYEVAFKIGRITETQKDIMLKSVIKKAFDRLSA